MRLSLLRPPRLCERLHDLLLYLAIYMTDKSCEDGVFLRSSRAFTVNFRYPLQICCITVTRVKDFVAGLTRAEKSYSEIKSMTECAFGVKSLHKSFTFCFIIKFKAGKSAEEEYNFNLRGLWILLPLSPPPCWKRCPFHCEGSCPGPSGFC